MKAFFDRLSDCIRIEKDTGRKLRGKKMAALSNSGDQTVYQNLFKAFELSAQYLGIHYVGDLHTWTSADGISDEVENNLQTFASKLSNT